MIRVCVIAVLAFVALVLVTKNLPDSAFRPAPRQEEAPTRVDALRGTWEGTLEMRRMDGTGAGTLAVRQVRSIEPGGVMRIEIAERAGDGSVSEAVVDVIRRQDAAGGAMYERTERRGKSPARLWQGTMQGKALVWSWKDASTGERQTFREEIMQGEGGPVLAVDGAGVRAGEPVLYAGRYRQVEREAR